MEIQTISANKSSNTVARVPSRSTWPPAWLRDRKPAAVAEPSEAVETEPELPAEPAPVAVAETPPAATEPSPWRCRCGSTTWQDFPIHGGQSVRRDCGRCGRFVCFATWYGEPHNPAREALRARVGRLAAAIGRGVFVASKWPSSPSTTRTTAKTPVFPGVAVESDAFSDASTAKTDPNPAEATPATAQPL